VIRSFLRRDRGTQVRFTVHGRRNDRSGHCMLYSLYDVYSVDSTVSEGLRTLVSSFRSTVDVPGFPCAFSSLPFTRQEIFFGSADEDAPEVSSVQFLQDLCKVIRDVPDAVGVLFVPQPADITLDDDFRLARRIIRAVMDQNAAGENVEGLPGPENPEWTLRLDGVGLFLNFSSPRHSKRRSRNVGPSFTVIVQSRATFDRPPSNQPGMRRKIRMRLGSYDDIGPHPCLGTFGDPASREALQYFLGDSDCPLDVAAPDVALPGRLPLGHHDLPTCP
jgi:uncharacterized protein